MDRIYKVVMLITGILLWVSVAIGQTQRKPNIVLMIADDLGYSDLECYGGRAKTPNLNQLAADGIRFTDFYAAAPNCSPSRAGLLTGISPAKLGMYNYLPPAHVMHLREEEITLAEVLKAQGYQTGHFGKWHLSALLENPELNQPQPHDQGFDHSLGTQNNAHPSHLNPDNFVRNGKALGVVKGYACQIVADEVTHWLDKEADKNEPFFAYVAFQEPHAPIASPPELVRKYTGNSTKDAEHLANIENMDLAVGKIIRYLKKHDLMENTLVIFSSDNGSYGQVYNGALRAVKSYLYDGGIRVPGIFHWPSLGGPSVQSEPAGLVDLMPTICEIVGAELPNPSRLDGTSILPLLNGNALKRENPLFWFFYRTSPEIAMRVGDLMIMGKDNDSVPRTHMLTAPDMTYIKQMGLENFELYDLRRDKRQRNDVINTDNRSAALERMLIDKLNEIQCAGYYWEDLAQPESQMRPKKDWVKY